MAEEEIFGQRLREFRIQAGFTLRELAEKIGVDFSYLSKIETGALPPPSEKVILRLAQALNADKDELMSLAGRIPSDIAELLRNREAVQMLRSRSNIQKKEKRGSAMTDIFKPLRKANRIAVPVFLLVAVMLSLWFAIPTQALEVSFPALPSGTLGSTHSFTVKVTITDPDLVPIQSVDVVIYNTLNPDTRKARCR